MDLNINRWRVELPDHESESYSDEEFDNSLFSSFAVRQTANAVRQTANADHSRIPIQFSSSSSNITFEPIFHLGDLLQN